MSVHKEANNYSELPAANGIRGLACPCVLFLHNISMVFPQAGPGTIGAGKIGVWLFFVLSAFLLTRRYFLTSPSMREIALYLNGRCWRILPLFFIAVIFYRVAGGAGIDTWEQAWKNMLFQMGSSHLWTIPVEFKFYFVLPLVAWPVVWVYRRYGWQAGLGVIAVMVLLHQARYPYPNMTENGIYTRWYLSSFFVGMGACFIPRRVNARWALVIGCGILITMVILIPWVRQLLFGIPVSRYLAKQYLLLSVLWVIFIVTQVDGRGALGEFLSQPFMQKIGAWSYGIYLFHWYFAVKARELAPENVAAIFVSIAAAICMGAAAYHFIEMPLASARKYTARLFGSQSA